MSEPCIMEEKITKTVEKIYNSIRWVLGICAGSVLVIVISVTTLGGVAIENKEKIQKINDDYAPLIIIQDLSRDNANLIKIIQLLPTTTKDDPRYINAINESLEFRSEALRRASSIKRGGNK